jgi:hypothetical protein
MDPHVSVVTDEEGVNDDASQADWYSPPDVPKALNTETSLELVELDSNLGESQPISEVVDDVPEYVSEVKADEQ